MDPLLSDVLGIIGAILLVSGLARLASRKVSEFGKGKPNLTPHGATTILKTEGGRNLYVGRAHGQVWIQLPSLEQGMDADLARKVAAAIYSHTEDAMAWRAMENAPKI